MKFRTFLLGLSALLIASAAAFFSVTGLSKLFAGASVAVMVMAGSLEFGKLIAASFIYNYWNRINFLLKSYLIIGVTVLIFITSLGIYGFLTSAYQTTANELSVIDKQVEVVEFKKNRLQEQLNGFVFERQTLSTSINELTRGLSNNVIQYTDSTGRLITTTSSATRRTLEGQLNDAKEQRDKISVRIEELTQQITDLDLEILSIQQSSEVAGEVGPLKFMADASGLPMTTIVNFFALMIVFVFDPMAVTLVIAFNTALKIDKGEEDKQRVIKKRYLYGEDVKEEVETESQTEVSENVVNPNEGEELDKIESKVDEILPEPLEEEEVDKKKVETTEEEKIDSELASLRPDLNKRPIDIDGNGNFDGWDTDGDGLIDEPIPSSSKRAQYVLNEKPYYARPGFDWGNKRGWINDQNAVNYWFKNVRNSDKYPTDFDSKTY